MSRSLVDPPLQGHVLELESQRRRASDFAQESERAVAAWRAGVAESAVAATARTCRTLADTHDRLAAALPGPDADPREAWRAIQTYSEAAAREVFGEVANRLDAGRVLGDVYDRTDAVLAALEEAIHTLPDRAAVPLDPSLFEPASGDGLLFRWNKSVSRARLSLRLAWRRAGNLFARRKGTVPAPVRTLSLRDFARVHVRGPLRAALLAAESEVRDQVASALLRLQRVAAAWARETLEAVDASDRGAWHVPTDAFPGEALTDASPDAAGLADTASALSRELRAVAEALSAVVVRCEVRDGVVTALERALATGGTILHPVPVLFSSADVPSRPIPSGAADRSLLAARLVAFRAHLADCEDDLHRTAVDGILLPLSRSAGEIRQVISRIGVDALRALDDHRGSEALARVQDTSKDQLEKLVRELARPELAEEAIRAATERARDAIDERIAALPATLRVPVGRDRRLVPLALRDRAVQAFERDLVRRVLEAYAPLRRELVRVWNDSEHVLQVVDSAFAAAAEELDASDGNGARRSAARTLVADGLRRASELVEDGYDSLRAPWVATAESVHRMLSGDWSDLERAIHTEDYLAKQWQDIRARTRRAGESAARSLRGAWEKLSQSAVVVYRAARIRIARIVRAGRAVVGVSETGGSERNRTLEAVTGAADVFAGLPLIYRKLFTLDALVEPSLAVNRQEDLVAVRVAFERWQAGNGPGLFIVRADPGSGRTSFLNLAARTLGDSARVVRLRFAERISDERVLALQLAKALDFDGAAPASLADLEKTIHAARPETTLVLVDDLEHLFLQTSGGTRLIENLLLFFARTDGSLFWCSSIGDLAWRFLERTLPAATGLVIGHALEPWDRAAVQDLVMERHRRTGMPLRFEAPEDPPPILRQRLRRARTPEQVQHLLRDEFFDALHRSSGQDPALALYGWVRTGRFDEDGDTLTLPPFRPLSFSFLAMLDADRAFVLRAFLTHHTLSPEELSRIFRMPGDHALAHLESLLALGLIEPVSVDSPASFVVLGTRYRLRRLVLQPVRKYLAERHFVY